MVLLLSVVGFGLAVEDMMCVCSECLFPATRAHIVVDHGRDGAADLAMVGLQSIIDVASGYRKVEIEMKF